MSGPSFDARHQQMQCHAALTTPDWRLPYDKATNVQPATRPPQTQRQSAATVPVRGHVVDTNHGDHVAPALGAEAVLTCAHDTRHAANERGRSSEEDRRARARTCRSGAASSDTAAMLNAALVCHRTSARVCEDHATRYADAAAHAYGTIVRSTTSRSRPAGPPRRLLRRSETTMGSQKMRAYRAKAFSV